MHNYRRQLYIALLLLAAGWIVGSDAIAWASPVVPLILSLIALLLVYGNHVEWQRNLVNRLDLQEALSDIRDETGDMVRKLSKETREVNHRVSNLRARVDEIRKVLIDSGFEFPKHAYASATINAGSPTISAKGRAVYTGPRWKRYYSIAVYLILREFGFRD